LEADYYEILGVSRDATEDEVKRAYRRLAREYHPDANPGDAGLENKFKALAEAFGTLSDPGRRREYDMFGKAGSRQASVDPFDIFASFFGGSPFGGGGRARSAQRGSDLVVGVEITLEEVIKGASRTISVRKLQVCELCSGRGAEPGTDVIQCPGCNGSGSVRNVARSIFGNVMSTFACPQCRGTGQQIPTPCNKCRGEGRVQAPEDIEVEVPAGIEDGMQLRLSGKGEAGPRTSAPGDLYVQIRVKPDLSFERLENDIVTSVAVPFTQATLGGALKVESFDGPVELEIQPGSQPGDVLRVKGKGVPRLGRGARGDLLVRLGIDVPKDLSDDQEEILRQFAAARQEQVAPPESLMGKIKSAFRS